MSHEEAEKLICSVQLSMTIIGDGDRSELSFIIARANPCEVRFGLFLAQIAPSLQNKNARYTQICVRIWTNSKVRGIFIFISVSIPDYDSLY